MIVSDFRAWSAEPGLAGQDSGDLPFDPSSSARVYLPSLCFLSKIFFEESLLVWFNFFF